MYFLKKYIPTILIFSFLLFSPLTKTTYAQYRTDSAVTTNIGNPSTSTGGQSANNNPCPNSEFASAYATDFSNNTVFSPKNFGDPNCDYTKDKLLTLLKQTDPKYWSRWFNVIVPGESSYDPNKEELSGSVDTAHAWGLYQMGRGKNGILDHGDVDWVTQTKNAVGYNQHLNTSTGTCPDNIVGNPWTWCYWATARQWWRQPL